MFNVVNYKKVTLTIGLIIAVLGIISLFFPGFNYDIDFTGGTQMEIAVGHEFELDTVSDIFKEVTDKEPSTLQYAGDDKTNFIVKSAELTSEQREEFVAQITEKLEVADAENVIISSENFSATVGDEMKKSAILASVVAVILMLIYITFRFELLSGIVAVCMLAHDILVIFLAYAVLRISVGTTFIAVLLTILGYSINNTIVIFDRIRENRRINYKEPFADTVNKSVAQTLTRSIYTTLTTLFTVGALYILGVDSIKDFALPMIIGLVAGTYSSVFMAGPLWVILRKLTSKNKEA